MNNVTRLDDHRRVDEPELASGFDFARGTSAGTIDACLDVERAILALRERAALRFGASGEQIEYRAGILAGRIAAFTFAGLVAPFVVLELARAVLKHRRGKR